MGVSLTFLPRYPPCLLQTTGSCLCPFSLSESIPCPPFTPPLLPASQVADVSTSKTGKHGHAKCVFVGIDIFTGKKMEDLTPSSHNCDVPHVTRTDYTLLDVTDDGFVSLMQENGDLKDDLTLPKGTDEAEKLAVQIKADFEAGKELIVSVLSVSPWEGNGVCYLLP